MENVLNDRKESRKGKMEKYAESRKGSCWLLDATVYLNIIIYLIACSKNNQGLYRELNLNNKCISLRKR